MYAALLVTRPNFSTLCDTEKLVLAARLMLFPWLPGGGGGLKGICP